MNPSDAEAWSEDGNGSRQRIRVDNGFGYGVIGADLHVFADRGPVYLLAEHRPPPVELDRAWLTTQPSRLLNARYQIVDFTGRTRERAELADWRDGGGPRVSAMWLHGTGGQGKSRLAAEFAADSTAAGWKVVTATHGPGAVLPQPGSQDLRLIGATGVLLIVDYADRWPVSHLTWLFSNKLLDGTVPTRLLLLARSTTQWPAVRAALEDLTAETGDLELAPLDAEPDRGARTAMFTRARDCFAACYGLADPTVVGPPDDLHRPDFGLVLAVHMAALVTIDAHTRGQRPPKGMAGLSAYLLNRERRHWAQLWENRLEGLEFGTPPSEMNRVVFTAALTGATTHANGKATLTRLGMERPERLLTDHAACYPSSEPGAVLEPLYPDRLAEDFLALSLPGHHITAYPAAPWAETAVDELTARHEDDTSRGHVARAVTFLASAAVPHRWPHVAHHLERILRADPALAVAAGSTALSTVAELDIGPAVMEAVEAHFPRFGQPDLDVGIAAFTERLTVYRLSTTDAPSERARLYQDLGFRLSRAGRREDAVAVTQEAVRSFRRAVADAAAYEPGLAMALVNLSECAFRAGSSKESRQAAEEAAKLFRKLAAADPAAYEPGLAMSLSHLGQGLSDSRRTEEALASTERAVGIFWRLAASHPSAYEPGLAMALANLGVLSWRLRRWSDGLVATERAVEIIRRWVTSPPSTDESDLARSLALDESVLALSLGNLAVLLWGARRRTDAISALQEAVGISRRLAAVNPEAHEPSLGQLTTNLGIYLSRVRRWKAALAAAEEAAEICGRLAAIDPARYEAALARSLQVSALARLGDSQDLRPAQRAADQAVGIYRRLAAQRPTEFHNAWEEALETQGAVHDALAGLPAEVNIRWTVEEHWSTLLNQDEVWQDAQDRRVRLDEMDPTYCTNVLNFILRQADGIVQMLLNGLIVVPESLGWKEGDDAVSWLERQPLVTALRRRAAGKRARAELCHCGYRIQPHWSHEYCYPGIIVD
ncbi:tetratricopeptide repeat protein [Streptomyces inhibens]|uniref:tetratricopeptide repeat protein n=1 Tax=Streptomyces inhibens TaxID=2293571 RepID=UPI00402ACC88